MKKDQTYDQQKTLCRVTLETDCDLENNPYHKIVGSVFEKIQQRIHRSCSLLYFNIMYFNSVFIFSKFAILFLSLIFILLDNAFVIGCNAKQLMKGKVLRVAVFQVL